MLEHRKVDPDLADMRGEAIDQLPEAEREGWRAFWARVEEVLALASRAPLSK